MKFYEENIDLDSPFTKFGGFHAQEYNDVEWMHKKPIRTIILYPDNEENIEFKGIYFAEAKDSEKTFKVYKTVNFTYICEIKNYNSLKTKNEYGIHLPCQHVKVFYDVRDIVHFFGKCDLAKKIYIQIKSILNVEILPTKIIY